VFDLKQIIDKPTRVCENSETTIDLILVFDVWKICPYGII